MQVPATKSSERRCCLRLGDELLDEELAAKDPEYLCVEVLGDPALSLSRYEPGQRPAPAGVSDDLDPGLGVDDDRGHAPASTRSSRSASAAPMLSSSGSGPSSSSSMSSRNALGEQSSSGFVCTITGSAGRCEAFRATTPAYPPRSWQHLARSMAPESRGMSALTRAYGVGAEGLEPPTSAL